MNKRIKKKKSIQDAIKQIYSIKQNDSDIIILEYRIGELEFSNLQSIFSMINRILKGTTLIALPDAVSLKSLKREQIDGIIEQLQSINK